MTLASGARADTDGISGAQFFSLTLRLVVLTLPASLATLNLILALAYAHRLSVYSFNNRFALPLSTSSRSGSSRVDSTSSTPGSGFHQGKSVAKRIFSAP